MIRRLHAGAVVLTILLGMVAATPVGAAAPKTRWVDDDGKAGSAGCGATRATFRRIQSAIDASKTGDTIIVCPGRYRQNLYIGGSGADRLTIRAAVRGTAVIRAPRAGGSEALVSVDGAVGTRLSGLVFQAPTSGSCRRVSALLRIEGSPGTRVVGSRFEPLGRNTIGACGYEDAIDVLDEATAFIDEVTIRDFRVHGVLVKDPGTAAVVEDSSIRFLHADESSTGLTEDAIGLAGRSGASITFRRNTVRGARTGGRSTPLLGSGIFAYQVSDPVVARNDVGYVLWAISVTTAGGSVHDNHVHHGRGFGAEAPIGYWIGGGELADIYGNTAKGYAAGILMEGQNHSVHDNDFRGNSPHDCRDVTGGAGTAGTANFWTFNLGLGSSPTGICAPP